MAIDLGASLLGTFALYGMLQVLKDVVVEVFGLAYPSPLTGRYLLVGLLYIAGTAPEAALAVLLCRTAALLSLLHLVGQLIDKPKIVNIIEKTGAVLIGYMAVIVLIKTKKHFMELEKIEELTGLDL